MAKRALHLTILADAAISLPNHARSCEAFAQRSRSATSRPQLSRRPQRGF